MRLFASILLRQVLFSWKAVSLFTNTSLVRFCLCLSVQNFLDTFFCCPSVLLSFCPHSVLLLFDVKAVRRDDSYRALCRRGRASHALVLTVGVKMSLLSLSLSFFLSLTHTHMYTHTHLYFSLCLSLTYKHTHAFFLSISLSPSLSFSLFTILALFSKFIQIWSNYRWKKHHNRTKKNLMKFVFYFNFLSWNWTLFLLLYEIPYENP